MEFTAKQIADFIHGTVVGDENAKISSFAKIEEAKQGEITFLANPKYTHYLSTTKATIVLVDEAIELNEATAATLIRVKNARDCVAQLLQLYDSMRQRKQGVSPLAFISKSATIGKNAYIAPFAYIGDNVVIGDNCQIYPNVTIYDGTTVGDNCLFYPNVSIYHDCKIGNNVTIHSGAVIGADGFGFAPNPEKDRYDKIPQIGIVTIEDDVEIGANTCIDRSTMGSTYVRKGVKLDNLVQIAHNDDIGRNTVMSAQVGIAGSTKVGQWCMFGGQVGVSGHIEVGDRVLLGAQSGAPGKLKANQTLIGTPPIEPRNYFKSQAIFRRLPEMYKELDELKKEIEKLKAGKE